MVQIQPQYAAVTNAMLVPVRGHVELDGGEPRGSQDGLAEVGGIRGGHRRGPVAVHDYLRQHRD